MLGDVIVLSLAICRLPFRPFAVCHSERADGVGGDSSASVGGGGIRD